MRASIARVFAAVGEDLAAGGVPRAFPAIMARIGGERSSQGATISEMLGGMFHGFEVVSEGFAEVFLEDPEARIFWEQSRARISYAGAAALSDAYLGMREAVMHAQAEEILRLSAPVLPLYPGILVLPLVGRLDAARAGQVTTSLLSAIVANAPEVVLLDVTGLPLLDAEAAEHLLSAARAARLVGVTPVLVGMSPTVARTVVEGGIDLAGVPTLGDLADGLDYALGVLGKVVVNAGRRRR
jgi:rsbT co-antagonist protein RsbR